jgi:SSS family solute:Na+ symporter
LLRLHVNPFDYAILGIYFALVVAIGVIARRAIATSEDFLLSGRSLPAWVTGLAFISANLGAIEILGSASSCRLVTGPRTSPRSSGPCRPRT